MLAAVLLALAVAFEGEQAATQAAGLAALDHQNYAEAERIFSQLATADAKDYSALFNLALAESALQKDDSAAAHYRQVLELKPGLYEAELNLGILDLRDRHPADALPLLQAAATQKPDQARVQRYLGEALLATGDPAKAAETFRAACTLNPKLPAAELGLGQSLVQQGKIDEALTPYNHAIALDPSLKSYLLELSVAMVKANRANDAIPLLEQFPNDAGAREELGRIYLDAKRPADAVAQFQAAVSLSSTPANQLALATAYLKNNQPDQAEPILAKSLAANPNDYDVRMTVARIHRDRHDYARAANEFVAAAQLKPDSPEAWNEAASAFVLAQQYGPALAALDKVKGLRAEIPGDFYYRALVLDKLHQVKPALANYQRFLQTSEGKFPDQEFIARQRSRILEKEAGK